MALGSDTEILSIGLHPSRLDYGKHPGRDEAALTARVEARRRRCAIRASTSCHACFLPIPTRPRNSS
ncbi:hypothetical protein ABZ540_19115 [Nocardia xishanensis]|uniref:hypothetical protein n=1 Tax=Nocardia xishanensis TaxID=238964 RepID=UPI0034049ABF